MAGVAGVLLCFLCSAAAAQNLLTNPSAETGDMRGWTIIEQAGGGWKAGADPRGLGSNLGGGLDGCSMFFTDDAWCRRSQMIDLLALGYTEGQLDAAPDIVVSEWFRGFSTWPVPTYTDTAYLTVVLLEEDGTTEIVSYDPGEFTTSSDWEEKGTTFSGYGAGLRYIYWEDGGKGSESRTAYDGPVLDAAFLSIGIAPAASPEIAAGPATLDFGELQRSGLWSDPQTITIQNTGTAEMEVNFCICEGAVDDFAFQDVSSHDPIPPGGSLELDVVFRPFTLGPRQAIVRIYSNDIDEPTTEIALQGIGLPVCTAITRADASPTVETTVDFIVTFSDIVSGVDASDFVLVQSGVTGSAITGVIDDEPFPAIPGDGIGKIWVVTVAIGTGNGTIGLNLVDNDSIISWLGSYPLGGVGTGNGDFAGGEVYQYLGTGQAFYVDDNAVGGGDGSSAYPFQTITEAINQTVAARGDIIIVRPGTYTERFTLKDGVTLESSGGSYRTHITGSNANQNIVTAAANSVIRGFTIRNAGTGAGVYVPAAASCTVTNCVLADSARGLVAATGTTVVFDNNTVYKNTTYGLRGEAGATFTTVRNNIFSTNGTAFSADSGGVSASGYNCFHANTANYSGPSAAATDFAADPQFVDAAARNWHLKAASPCRNAGSPSSSYNDKDGSRNDVGADGGPNGVRDTVVPVASFTASPTSGDAPLTVNFNGTASSDEWGIAAYLWDFNSSNGIQVEATGATSSRTFTAAGSFIVTLRVQDNSGLFAQTTRQISVNAPGNVPPTASASASPRAGAAPFEVQFTGTGSDPDGGTVTYSWDFGDESTSSAQSPLYTYPSDTSRGSYEAILTVTDNENVSTQDSVFVTVTQETPDASAEVNPAAQSVVTVSNAGSAINGAQATVPAGAVADPIVVSLGAVPAGNEPEPPVGAVSEVVEAGPEGAAFSQPVMLRIPLNTSVTATQLLTVAAYDEDGKYWTTEGLSNVQFVDATPVDYVTVDTEHFSFFVVLFSSTGPDIDRNGTVNAIDVQLVINGALNLPVPPGMNTDVNGDGATNAIDVQVVINAALGL